MALCSGGCVGNTILISLPSQGREQVSQQDTVNPAQHDGGLQLGVEDEEQQAAFHFLYNYDMELLLFTTLYLYICLRLDESCNNHASLGVICTG